MLITYKYNSIYHESECTATIFIIYGSNYPSSPSTACTSPRLKVVPDTVAGRLYRDYDKSKLIVTIIIFVDLAMNCSYLNKFTLIISLSLVSYGNMVLSENPYVTVL